MSKDVGICPQDGCNQPSKHLLKVKGKFRGDVQEENILAFFFFFFSPPFYDVGRVEVLILAPLFFSFIAEIPLLVVVFVGGLLAKLVNCGESERRFSAPR